MVTMKELLGHLNISDVPVKHQHNLEELLIKVNKIRDAFAKPMRVTSGYRTIQDQRRINPKAMGSKHLIGCAVDIADDGSLYKWLHDEPQHLEAADLYCELDTNGWVHFQSLPFGSYKPGGTRWFKA
jgi:uncharacterized protein YcbK (DUF882 family)